MFNYLIANTSFKQHQTQYWPEQPITANALAITQFCKANQPVAVTLIIETSVSKANQMWQALDYFNDGTLKIAYFSDYETLPYDIFSPDQEIISSRLDVLNQLVNIHNHTDKPLLLVASIDTLMQRLPPKTFIEGNSFDWKTGDCIALQPLSKRFSAAGYQAVSSVQEHGEFCIRGSLLDIYPMGSQYPLRLDFFGNELDSIRLFNPATQLTITKIDKFQLLPAHEYILNDKTVLEFKTQWFKHFEQEKAEPLRLIEQMRPFAGIESYLALLHSTTDSIIDYLPDHSLIIQNQHSIAKYREYWQQIQQRYDEYPNSGQRPPLPPKQLYLAFDEWNEAVNRHNKIELNSPKSKLVAALKVDNIEIKQRATQGDSEVQAIKNILTQKRATLFCVGNYSRQEWLKNHLGALGIDLEIVENWRDFNQPRNCITIAPLTEGFVGETVAVITEQELFATTAATINTQTPQPFTANNNGEQLAQNYIRNLLELEKGEAVVHLEHGIGIYMGLETIAIRGQTDEFLIVHYADDDKLYVPVSALHLISKYVSGQQQSPVKLHKLGSERWDKARQKATKIIRDSAAELLTIYAKRESRRGESMSCSAQKYQNFCDEFPYRATQDQLAAITAIIDDMKKAQPMDRLVCGDVGFGKTEVAMRAAFIAASSHRQSIVMVPTTLLASQHLQTFVERFANWPVQIDMVSRLQTSRAEQQSIQRFNQGKTDILVGTHKLLFADLDFKSLGLLIIDEEHRFGVRQKEKLKGLRAEVDILALTATPIPRSLNMALASMRDLSIIAEPPAKRLSVKTFVCIYDLGIIKEAIQRELHRGGQVYFLHNEIKTIERTAEMVAKLVPEANIAVGHGQMPERQLERVMFNFHQQRNNVLVCSTIIETGIDNPNANTIIVERSDKLGLAQLHQLRGRVGRSHHQAYAYMLTPEPAAMSKDARRRLEAIQRAEHLGSGFTLATYDLEIRGAGELLGEQQSGQISAIGIDLFQELLAKAINDLRSGATIEDFDKKPAVEINLGLSALIPSDYLPDVTLRLGLYKRIAAAKTKKQLEDIQLEMLDRFGLLPNELNYLLQIAALRQQSEQIGIEKIICSDRQCKIWIQSDNLIEPLQVITLIQQHSEYFAIMGANAIVFNGSEQHLLQTPSDRVDSVFYIIDVLLGRVTFQP